MRLAATSPNVATGKIRSQRARNAERHTGPETGSSSGHPRASLRIAIGTRDNNQALALNMLMPTIGLSTPDLTR